MQWNQTGLSTRGRYRHRGCLVKRCFKVLVESNTEDIMCAGNCGLIVDIIEGGDFLFLPLTEQMTLFAMGSLSKERVLESVRRAE